MRAMLKRAWINHQLLVIVVVATVIVHGMIVVHIVRTIPSITGGTDLRWSQTAEYLYRDGIYSVGDHRDAAGNVMPTGGVPPLYTLAYAGSYTLFGIGQTAHEAMRVLQVLMNLGIVLVVWRIGSLFSRWTGYAAATIAAADFSALFFAMNHDLPDVAVSFLQHSRCSTWSSFSGRSNPFMPSHAARCSSGSPCGRTKETVRLLGTFPPYMVFSSEVMRALESDVYTSSGHRALLGRLWHDRALGYLSVYSAAKAHLIIIYALVGIAAVAFWRRTSFRPVLILFGLVIAYSLAVSGAIAQARYRMVFFPVLYALAGYGVSQLIDWYARRRPLFARVRSATL